MNHMIVGTRWFWAQMCRPGFVRIDRHRGVNRDTMYVTKTPPEDVPGFVSEVIDGIHRDLRLKPLGPA